MLGILNDPHRRHLLLTLLVAVGLVAYLVGSLEAIYDFDLAMLLALVGGFPIYFGALNALVRGKLSAELAVSLAAFAALYLGYRGGYDENMYAVAAEVILIMLIGEALENYAVGRTRSAVAALLQLRPETARVRRRHGQEQVGSGQWAAGRHDANESPHSPLPTHHSHELVVLVEEIRSDDVVIVRPGDRIAIDGRVLSGNSAVDQSSITGESLPADKTAGDEVFAGTINLNGAMELSVERLGEDTTLEQIIHLVEEAEAAKAPTQRLADRYAAYFVPIVLAAAGLTYLFTGATWFTSGDVVRAVAVLVVACPCALVLATPTAIAAGIGSLVRRGVLIKGGTVLESLGRLQAVVFDKTGTLTAAKLRVAEIVPAPGNDATEVLRLALAVERHSEHPVARLIVARAEQERIRPPGSTGFVAHPGLGAEAMVVATTIRVGSPRFLEEAGVAVPPQLDARVAELSQGGCTVVLVARGKRAIGAVAVEDTVRPEAATAIRQLRDLGIDRIAMLTGDNAAAADAVAQRLSIEDVRSGLLPGDKVEAVRQIQAQAATGSSPAGGTVAMVGDGINDAPSLAAADVGVAMAQIGTDVAIASADVVLVGDDLTRLADAVECGRRALKIVWQNILGFALVFNILAVAAAMLGWIGPVAAAVLHQVGSLTVVLNSMRLLVDRRRWKLRIEAAWRRLWQRRRRWATALFVIAATAYLSSGLHVVRPGEVAVVKRFGKVTRSAAGSGGRWAEPPGLHYRLPYPLGSHVAVMPAAVRRVEIGFRTIPGTFAEPPAYEWNVQHRGGRYEPRPEEATVWAGDENLADVNMVVHYRVSNPKMAVVNLDEPRAGAENKWDVLVRGTAEAALRCEITARPVEALFGPLRPEIERAVLDRIAGKLRQYETGLAVESVCLGDVHPPLEVVPEYRQVAEALEDKQAEINKAEAYQYEQEALTEGESVATVLAAEALGYNRVKRAEGSAARFSALVEQYQAAPTVTRLRLYLETVEQTLAGRRKIIFDRAVKGARRQLLLGRKNVLGAIPAWATEPRRENPDAEGYDGP